MNILIQTNKLQLLLADKLIRMFTEPVNDALGSMGLLAAGAIVLSIVILIELVNGMIEAAVATLAGGILLFLSMTAVNVL